MFMIPQKGIPLSKQFIYCCRNNGMLPRISLDLQQPQQVEYRAIAVAANCESSSISAAVFNIEQCHDPILQFDTDTISMDTDGRF